MVLASSDFFWPFWPVHSGSKEKVQALFWPVHSGSKKTKQKASPLPKKKQQRARDVLPGAAGPAASLCGGGKTREGLHPGEKDGVSLGLGDPVFAVLFGFPSNTSKKGGTHKKRHAISGVWPFWVSLFLPFPAKRSWAKSGQVKGELKTPDR